MLQSNYKYNRRKTTDKKCSQCTLHTTHCTLRSIITKPDFILRVIFGRTRSISKILPLDQAHGSLVLSTCSTITCIMKIKSLSSAYYVRKALVILLLYISSNQVYFNNTF